MTDRAPAPADVEAIAERMARISDRAVAAAEAVWTEEEPSLAEYELAQAILDADEPALATLRAHERANALRDAADECHKEARWQTELQMRHTGTPSASQHYLAARQLSRVEGILRDRADRQEPTP